MADLPSQLKCASTAIAQIDELLLAVEIPATPWASTATKLCLTVAEQFSATLCLLENGFSSHAPIIVRSMLEAHANLLNLASDEGYLDQMRYESARNDTILFTEYSALPEMQDDDEALKALNEWKSKAEPLRDELHGKGFRKIDVIEKFKRAGILGNYVAYRVFCSFSHNELLTLHARHHGEFHLQYEYEAPPEMTKSLLSVALSILCRSVITLPKYSSATDEQVEQLANSIDKQWQSVTAAEATAAPAAAAAQPSPGQ